MAMTRGWGDAWPAPAKLNLFLHVIGRRADGYHLLQTLFRLIDLADTLRFAPREDGDVRLAAPLPGVPEDADLTVRAARLLQRETHTRRGVTIALEKRVPMGGGLGGGSSDAATTLLALNTLWDLGLPRARLAELGLMLGADVPFFIFGRNAFAEGIGEALTAVDLPPAWYLVATPQVSVPTQEIFADRGLTRNTKPVKIAVFFEGTDPEVFHNDLEPVVIRKYPAVGAALDWLNGFNGLSGSSSVGERGRMSGSGASVFAAFSDEAGARRAVEQAVVQTPEGLRVFVVRGLDVHPLA
jgi:4-diphosphocytidyl-2-C-methyl-D-erythritol kinase